MDKLVFKAAFVGLLFIFCISLSSAWWNENWEYRKTIEVKEESNNDLENYQISIDINTSKLISESKLQLDCGDLRFADESENLLNHWIESGECNKDNTTVWVNIPNITSSSSKNIFMYYGNEDAESKSNRRQTFLFYDNLESGDMTQWTTDRYTNNRHNFNWRVTSSPSIGNYALEESTGDYYLIPDLSSIPGTGFKAQFSFRRDSNCCSGINFEVTDSTSDNSIAWGGRNNYNMNSIYLQDCSGNRNSLSGFSSDTWYEVEATFDGSTAMMTVNGNSQSISCNLDPEAIRFDPYIYNGGDGYVDEVRIRNYVDPKPQISLGVEETSGISICDKRGVHSECISNSSHEISGQSFNISSIFKVRETSLFEALGDTALLKTTNSSAFSGIWRGSFNITSQETIIKPGARFRPKNGNILIN